jgi:hypothetical protein
VAITGSLITLNRSTTCAGTSGFSQVTINYSFSTVAPKLLPSLTNGLTIPATACYPNSA